MKRDLEHTNYSERERLARLENRAAKLERMLSGVPPRQAAAGNETSGHATVRRGHVQRGGGGDSGYRGATRSHGAPEPEQRWTDRSRGAVQAQPRRATRIQAVAGFSDWPEGHADPDEGYDEPDEGYDDPDEGYDDPDGDYDDPDEPAEGWYRDSAAYHVAGPPGYGAGFAGGRVHGYGAAPGAQRADERTSGLIDRGRRHARPKGLRRWTKHWRAIGICAVAFLAGAIALAVILSGSSPSWPASVAVVQREISAACQNPNVVSEPSQVNFACAKDTSQILWVFSLLTSGDNPNFSDRANGRQGLEPITPAQGGDVAWSLNLHHPYDPANPTDSLEVAARAINDIIGGATLTGSNGAPVVEPGLESNAGNCARYTGSSALVTHQGFPAICAQPVTGLFGQAALVSDVFKQWMLGASSQVAANAGVLFANADNPGDPQVQAILNSLPQTRL
jgi:hypothetical protein